MSPQEGLGADRRRWRTCGTCTHHRPTRLPPMVLCEGPVTTPTARQVVRVIQSTIDATVRHKCPVWERLQNHDS